jgi:polyhydroxyalkanoate synthase
MAEQDAAAPTAPSLPTLEEMQHWTHVMGRAQQMMMEHVAQQMGEGAAAFGNASPPKFEAALPWLTMFGDPAKLAQAQVDLWTDGLSIWQRALGQDVPRHRDRRQGRQGQALQRPRLGRQPAVRHDPPKLHPGFRTDARLGRRDRRRGRQAARKLRFITRGFVDAMSPSNFAATNPLVLQRAMETKGESLLKGLENMLRDLSKGQLTHTDPEAFEVGRNIAVTPGKVVKRTPLYELVQYTPTTETVHQTPLVIFPPWINRFYILDLNPKKSFIRWAVEQGLTVFVVSWKSADESLKDTVLDDYVMRGQVDAIDTIRELLGVRSVHAIGYCVAGTTLACTLSLLAARGEADKVASATFFTAQVDFSEAGDLNLLVGDETMQMIGQMSAEKGFMDGRYMAADLQPASRPRPDLELCHQQLPDGRRYPPSTSSTGTATRPICPPSGTARTFVTSTRTTSSIQPGAIIVDGTPIDLARSRPRPTSSPAARTISRRPRASGRSPTTSAAPSASSLPAAATSPASSTRPKPASTSIGPTRRKVSTVDEFVDGASETKGSWWPDWIKWIGAQSEKRVPAKGPRIPGKGKLKAIEDAPGSYVRGQ